jgi:lysophospholipase L1-like esterase
MLHLAARLALAPLLYVQATRLRKTVPELPEPPGARSGVAGSGAPALRLLVAGDSSAAGVGASTQDEALALPLARALSARLARSVAWQLVARTGLTSQGVLRYLLASDVGPADVAVVVCGVNDITKEVALDEALRQRERIVRWLREERGVRHVCFPALPEMETFPSVPSPLAWYAGRMSRRNNRAQARWAVGIAGASHAPMDGVAQPPLFAEDGFHPAPELYRRVAQRLVEHLAGFVPGATSGAQPKSGSGGSESAAPTTATPRSAPVRPTTT